MELTTTSFNAYTDSRWVNLGFSFGVVSPGAAETAAPTSSVQAVYSSLNQLCDSIETPTAKYATLEQDLFLLDGSFHLYPDMDRVADSQIGWLSAAISGADGTFTENPWIVFTLPEKHSSFGFTIVGNSYMPDEYGTEILLQVWDENNSFLINETVQIDSWNYFINLPADDYKKVRVEFLKTSKPYRRVRLTEFIFGAKYNYEKKSIVSANSKSAVSPWMETLSSDEFSATINNQNQLYNMVNPTGLYRYLQDGQYMDWWVSVNGEEINMGRQYFTRAESQDGGLTANITFNDWLLMLDSYSYNNGTTGTWTLAEAIASIIAVSGLAVTAVFDDDLGETIIGKCVPQSTSCREAIRLAAQAAMSACYVDRNNQLHFFRPQIGNLAEQITRRQLAEDAQIKIGEYFNYVKLTVTDEYTDDGFGEIKPTTNIYTASNIVEGEIVRPYELDNPLVVKGQDVADWLLSWVERRTRYEFRYRGNPAVDLLDTLQIHDVYGVNANSVLIEHNFSYDGGMVADGKTIK